ncbi:MAG: hypothetical protein IIY53_07085 [Solobacterium sp.]|nr:hypothetical protein [Solobacterium sp.]
MKKLITVILTAVMLGACGGKAADPTPTPADAPTPAPAGVPTAKPASERPGGAGTAGSETPHPYVAGMEGYEDLEVAFLGTVNSERSRADVVARAASELNLPLAAEIDEDHVIYGDLGEYEDNVYLIIPAADTDLRVGRYSWYAGEITEVWYEAEKSQPILYVESAESDAPAGMIEYVRHFADGTTDGFIYTGFDLGDRVLRTAFHMGVVDITPYDFFSSDEIPFKEQSLFDALLQQAEVSQAVNSGGELMKMGEFCYDANMYLDYVLRKDDTDTHWAAGYLPDGTVDVICSEDGQNWTHPAP